MFLPLLLVVVPPTLSQCRGALDDIDGMLRLLDTALEGREAHDMAGEDRVLRILLSANLGVDRVALHTAISACCAADRLDDALGLLEKMTTSSSSSSASSSHGHGAPTSGPGAPAGTQGHDSRLRIPSPSALSFNPVLHAFVTGRDGHDAEQHGVEHEHYAVIQWHRSVFARAA